MHFAGGDVKETTAPNYGALPLPMYHTTSLPQPPITTTSPLARQASRPAAGAQEGLNIDASFVRKFGRFCGPVAIITSMCLSIAFLQSILSAIFAKSGYSGENSDKAVWFMFIVGGIGIFAFGMIAFLCTIVGFASDALPMFHVYSAYHYLTDTFVLMGIIAVYVNGMAAKLGPWPCSVLFFMGFLAFFIFTNYTHWQICQMKKILMMEVTEEITVAVPAHPPVYVATSTVHDYGAPPVYPGSSRNSITRDSIHTPPNDDPESRPHSQIGNWVQITTAA